VGYQIFRGRPQIGERFPQAFHHFPKTVAGLFRRSILKRRTVEKHDETGRRPGCRRQQAETAVDEFSRLE